MAMTIAVRVKPNAKSSAVKKVSDREYRASVNAAPEHGKANRALIDLLAAHFKVAGSSIQILHGHRSQRKLIRIG